MWHKISKTLGIIIVFLLALGLVLAQDSVSSDDKSEATATASPSSTATVTSTATMTNTPTPTMTATPQATQVVISALAVQPSEFVQGTGGTMSISGENFSSNTTVTLNGSIVLPVSSQSSETLVVSIGTDVSAGIYTVQLSDPLSGNTTLANAVTVTEPTAIPQLTITQSEPSQVTYGQNATLSILGANFTNNTTVRLVGFGLLSTSFINSNAITATIPASLPIAQYTIEVSDPIYGTETSSETLTVAAAAVTATPIPTATTAPGQPILVVRNFTASPSSIYPGEETLLTFEVVNVGTRTAQGIVITLGNSNFVSANGQASLMLPALSTYSSYSVSLSVTASSNIAEGPNNVPLELSFYDVSGQAYNDEANLSVNILSEEAQEAQLILDSYLVTPNTALPGDSVTIQALFTNMGNDSASQVLVELNTNDSVLIAGSAGSSFALGDIEAGGVVPIVMPLIVASNAQSGVQSQSFTITYMQGGESHQASASISLNIEQVVEESPLLLLTAYDTGEDEALQPGQEFTYTMSIQNAGTVDVSDLLVSFGQDKSSSTSTSTSSSISFAPLGSGDTVLLGDLAAGDTTTVSQDFIVNDGVSSGVYSLSMTLQYMLADGTSNEDSFSASLIVIEQPRLRITLDEALDDPLTAGESYDATIDIANLGSSDVALTQVEVLGDNLSITEGAETLLESLQSDDDTSVDITLQADSAGEYTLTVEVEYLNDLNRLQTDTVTFSGEVSEAEQPQRPTMPFTPSTESTTEDANMPGRLLLGFLGFGG